MYIGRTFVWSAAGHFMQAVLAGWRGVEHSHLKPIALKAEVVP